MHKDIAFEFASWISIEFKLYVIKEFQRLKQEESERLNLRRDFSNERVVIFGTMHLSSNWLMAEL